MYADTKILPMKKKLFLDFKNPIYLSLQWDFIKYVQATGEASSPRKKPPMLQDNTFLHFMCAQLDPDPNPAEQINADPWGSGSATLI
jgi:hypothetical protein